MSRRLPAVLVALISLVLASPHARAHDAGITRAELRDAGDGHYALAVRSDAAERHEFAPPVLPARCAAPGGPRAVRDGDWLRFDFTCEPGLRASDTLTLPWRSDAIMLHATWSDGGEARRVFDRRAGAIRVRLADLGAGSGSWRDAARRYTALGIEHILLGVDHLLFVLALLMVVRRAWTLVQTVTAFTVAHSITLGLATVGAIAVPARPVEAAIALSIVFLCAEIVHASRGRIGLTHRAPWLVAFVFGLLHGLGFAGALAGVGLPGVGLPGGELPLALAFFNVGVEIGQLAFIAAALAPLALARRSSVQVPALVRFVPVYAIGTVAAYWLLERVEAMLPGA